MSDESEQPQSLPPMGLSKQAQDRLAKMDLTAGQVAMISLLADVAVDRWLKESHDQEEQ